MAIFNSRILITGGAGFIGSTLAGRFDASNDVILFDNLNRGQETPVVPNARFQRGDVLELDTLLDAMHGCDYVIHAAAIAGIDTVVKSPVSTLRTNLLGTANVLEAAKIVGVSKRVVSFSTSEVYGTQAFRVSETDSTVTGSVGEARWTYSVSKLAGEHLASAYFHEFGLPCTTVRPFNVYGPGQIGEGAMKVFIDRALQHEAITIHGDGNQIRAWCFVDDFVRGLELALESPAAVGESFNIGNPRAVITILGLAQTVCRVLGSDSRIVHVDQESVDVELRIPDTTKARDLLGFSARVDLDEGISLTAQGR